MIARFARLLILLICVPFLTHTLAPLAILHAHLEALLTPAQMRDFANSKGMPLTAAEIAYQKTYRYPPTNWQPFQDGYMTLPKRINQAQDFYTLTLQVLKNYADQGVVYAELICSPDLATHNCAVVIPWQDMLDNIQEAIVYAQANFGITARAQMTFVRDQNSTQKGADALNYVQYLIANKQRLSNITAINLVGDERSFPNVQPYAEAYALAKKSDIGCSVHVGELGNNPQDMWTAIQILNPDRIDHGIAAIKDPTLMAYLIKNNIPLTICPSSNLCLGNCTTYQDNPLLQLMQAGVPLVHSQTDDDFLFNTDPTIEAEIGKAEYGFTDDNILENTKRAIAYGFLKDGEKSTVLEKINQRTRQQQLQEIGTQTDDDNGCLSCCRIS